MDCERYAAAGAEARWFGGAHVAPWGTKARVARRAVQALDPIDVAACLDSEVLRNWCREHPFSWAEQLGEFLRGAVLPQVKTVAGERPQWAVASSTDAAFAANVQRAVDWGVFAPAEVRRGPTVRYFQVPKKGNIDRVILDCSALNDLLPSPPHVALVEPKHVIGMLLRMGPWAATLTADARHFFHQMALHPELRRCVTFKVEDNWFESCTLPMGMSWAPYCAQATSCLVLQLALQRFVRNHPEYSMRTKGDAVEGGLMCPPRWFELVGADGQVHAYLFVFYDNFTVIARSEKLRDHLWEYVKARARRVNLQWKGEPPETRAVGSLVLLGFEAEWQEQDVWEYQDGPYVPAPHRLRWRVNPSSIAGWLEKDQQLEREAVTDPEMSVDRAQFQVGCAVWENVVRGTPFSPDLAVSVAARAVSASEPVGPESLAAFAVACSGRYAYADPIGHHWRSCDDAVNVRMRSRRLWVASDASNWGRGAMGWFKGAPGEQFRFTCAAPWMPEPGDGDLPHINVRETQGAIEGLVAGWEQVKRRWNAGTPGVNLMPARICLLVDNMAAAAWLRRWWSPDERARATLRRILQELRRANVELSVFHLAGSRMPADGTSRGTGLPTEEEWAAFRSIIESAEQETDWDVEEITVVLHGDVNDG
jgi:hypothetical protein